MHNLDIGWPGGELMEQGFGHEVMPELAQEYQELPGELEGAFPGEQEGAALGEAALPIPEFEELELAMELMEVTNEQELEQFLGGVWKAASKEFNKAARPYKQRAMACVTLLKGAAAVVLPRVLKVVLPKLSDAAIKTVITKVEQVLSNQVAGRMEKEMGEVTMEEGELEAARRFVRLAGSTFQRAINAPPRMDPVHAARDGFRAASRRLFLSPVSSGRGVGIIGLSETTGAAPGRSGRWVKRGSRIILYGV